jgi:hypothetical protein
MIKRLIKSSLSTIVILLMSYYSYAQPCVCGDCLLCPPPPPGNPVPITGIEWLIGGGAILGVRQFLVSRKKENKIG